MVYKKDGKLLVKDGKLCSTCCIEYDDDCNACEPDPFPDGQTPRYFDVTFADVVVCDGHVWPNGISLNATWRLEQTGAYPCIWQYDDGNWSVSLYLDSVGTTIIGAMGSVLQKPFFRRNAEYGGALPGCTAEASGIANGQEIEDCGDLAGCIGYDGTVSWEPG